MNEDLVLAITMLIILAVVVLFIQISQQIKVKRIQKMKIQRRFGEIPDMEEILPIERISEHCKIPPLCLRTFPGWPGRTPDSTPAQ